MLQELAYCALEYPPQQFRSCSPDGPSFWDQTFSNYNTPTGYGYADNQCKNSPKWF